MGALPQSFRGWRVTASDRVVAVCSEGPGVAMRHAEERFALPPTAWVTSWTFIVEISTNRPISPRPVAVTVRHMSDMPGTVRHDSHEEGTTTSVVDLHSQLNRAYLSGDGAAVERVLALLAQAQDGATGPADTAIAA
jgi:hypothetical protein